MRAVVQRVRRASVEVNGKITGRIDRGLVILLGVARSDTDTDASWLAEKCANLRIFDNEEGKFDRSLLDVGGRALVVSQFTLFGDCRRGRRPDFIGAAEPALAEVLYERFTAFLRERGIDTATGVFRADMQVEIHNDGPVTLILDSPVKP
jgi:D-aminoacyl-tRNA deacylase